MAACLSAFPRLVSLVFALPEVGAGRRKQSAHDHVRLGVSE